MNKAYNKRKLYTNPIEPDTSTDENPINAHLTKLLDINGFLAILFNNIANIIIITIIIIIVIIKILFL